jgi:hypothetical protein
MSTANVASIRSAGSEPERRITATMSMNDQVTTLEALIRKPPTNSRVIEFSPKLAEYILTNLNVKNRPMKPTKVAKYASDLGEGLWGLTGDTIKFGGDGFLKDGQNRLSACVRSQRPMKSHVVFGIDPQLFARMDIGKNRNGADVFSIAGISRANHVSAAVRWLLILTGDDPGNRGAQFSNEELLKAHREKFEGDRLERSIQAALAVKKTCSHPVGPLAALHYLFSQRDEAKADAFFDEWATGRSKKVRAPAKFLQKRLLEIATASNNRVHENVRNALIITAWNAYISGLTVSKAEMQHAISDPMPKISG